MKHLSKVTKENGRTLYCIGIEFSDEELKKAFARDPSVTLSLLSEFRKDQMLDCELAFLRILVSNVDIALAGPDDTLEQLLARGKKEKRRIRRKWS